MNLLKNPFEFVNKLSETQKSQYFFGFFCALFVLTMYFKDWTFERWMIAFPAQVGLPLVWLLPNLGVLIYLGSLFFQFTIPNFTIPFFPFAVVTLYQISMMLVVLGRFASTKKFKNQFMIKGLLIGIYVMYCFFSVVAFNSGYPEKGLSMQNWELTHNIELGFVFFLIVFFFDKFKRIKMLYWVVVICSFLFSLRAFRRFVGTGFGFVPDVMGYDNNYAALMLLTSFPFALYLIFSEKFWLQKIQAAIISTIMFITVLIPARSRGGFLGLMVVSFFIFLKRMTKPTTWVIVLLGILLIPVIMPQELLQRVQTLTQIEDIQNAEDGSIQGRYEVALLSIDLIKQKPLFGYGLGSAKFPAVLEFLPRAPHNVYLELGIDLGLIGLLIYLGIILFTFIEIFLAKRHLRLNGLRKHPAYFYLEGIQIGLIGYCVSSTFLNVSWYPLIWIMMGMTTALYGIVKTELVPNAGKSISTATR